MYQADSSNRSRRILMVVSIGAILMILLMAAVGVIFARELWFNDGTEYSDGLNIPSHSQNQSGQSGHLNQEPTLSPTASNKETNEYEQLNSQATPILAYVFPTKEIIGGAAENRPRWTATPLPTSTPSPTPSLVPTFVGENYFTGLLRPSSVSAREKWIDVNLTTQTLVAFEGNAPVFQSLVSTGTSEHPTVTGQFRIWLRFSSQDMNGYRLGYDYFLRNVPYVQYFYEDYSLHGTFWHNNFGTPMSHGCVNLPTPSAEWLFNWAEYGTLVNVHK